MSEFERRKLQRELEELRELQRERTELSDYGNNRRINLLLKHAEFLIESGLQEIRRGEK